MRWGVAATVSSKDVASWLTGPLLCVFVCAERCRRPSPVLGASLTGGRNCCRTGLRWAAINPIITGPESRMHNRIIHTYHDLYHTILLNIFCSYSMTFHNKNDGLEPQQTRNLPALWLHMSSFIGEVWCIEYISIAVYQHCIFVYYWLQTCNTTPVVLTVPFPP